MTQGWAIGLVLIAGAIGGFGPIYLKRGASRVNMHQLRTIYKNGPLIVGFIIYALSAILFIPALKGGDLSVLYPLVGLSYLWVSIYSVFLLNEKMHSYKWIGVAFIIVGVSLVGFGV